VRSYGGLQDREWSRCELMLFQLRDLEFAGRRLVLGSTRKGEVMDARKVAAWFGQQFSGGMLACVYKRNSMHVLNLCVRHDVAVLDVGTTF
jgi:hypothetical protein